jgi:methyl-accepting chemotaxis protein
MSEFHYLIGADDALRASHNMESAADRMNRAAENMAAIIEHMHRSVDTLTNHIPDAGNMVAIMASNVLCSGLVGKSVPSAMRDAVLESVEVAKWMLAEANKP